MGYFMTDIASTRSEGVATVHTQIAKLQSLSISHDLIQLLDFTFSLAFILLCFISLPKLGVFITKL